MIRTAQGWKDNRQNNVLFKDGSPPLFLKVVRRPKEAGLNTGGNKGVVPCRAQAFIFRNVLQSNFQKIQILNAHCVRFNKKTHYKKHHIFIPPDTKLSLSELLWTHGSAIWLPIYSPQK